MKREVSEKFPEMPEMSIGEQLKNLRIDDILSPKVQVNLIKNKPKVNNYENENFE